MPIEFFQPFPALPIKNGTAVVLGNSRLGDGALQYSSASYMTPTNPSGYISRLQNRFNQLYYYYASGNYYFPFY